MERFRSEERPDTEFLYDELKQRLEYGGNTIEWWQAMFRDLQETKQYLTDQNLVVEIDAFCSEFADLAQYIRKDEKSMQAALRTAHVLAERVIEAIKRG